VNVMPQIAVDYTVSDCVKHIQFCHCNAHMCSYDTLNEALCVQQGLTDSGHQVSVVSR